MKKTILLNTAMLISISCGFAQQVQRCGTMEYMHKLEAADPALASKRSEQDDAVREWINTQAGASQQSIVSIPVVFHILYNDSTQNLSDAVIYSQMEAINEDYQRLNADTFQTPLPFRSVAADCEIQFCLAVRDQYGFPTQGIVRKHTTVTGFNDWDDTKHNATGGDDAWDATRYMNVWIAPFSNPSFLGIGTFPNSVTPDLDGIVINYKACGRVGDHLMEHYNKGRSLTHEIGHYLNLHHIWGDDGYLCNGDDYISDTPNQSGETYGCPAYPRYDSCSSSYPGIMFMNFMDYTDDECMNLYTEGQKAWMLAALNLDRSSLLASLGCTPVGIAEYEIRKHIKVYPNPASEEIFLVSDHLTISGYEIQNMVGETVLISPRGLKSFTRTALDISSFSPGIYFLKINSQDGDAVFKIVKR